MLPVTPRRVFLAKHRVDFRREPDGMLGEAYLLGADRYPGDCALFVKRDQPNWHTTPRPVPALASALCQA